MSKQTLTTNMNLSFAGEVPPLLAVRRLAFVRTNSCWVDWGDHLHRLHHKKVQTDTNSGGLFLYLPTDSCLSASLSPIFIVHSNCLSVCLYLWMNEWMMLTVIVLFPYFSLVQLKESRTVRQFQYTDWPDSGMPDTGVGLVDLIGQVQKWQQHSGDSAIVVHCRFVSMFVFTNF